MADYLDVSFERSEVENKGNNGKKKSEIDSPNALPGPVREIIELLNDTA